MPNTAMSPELILSQLLSLSDPETNLVYQAEAAFREGLDDVEKKYPGATGERKFADLVEVQAYVDDVLSKDWVKSTFDRATLPVHVVPSETGDGAHTDAQGNLALPDGNASCKSCGEDLGWALRETVVLHELAHHLAWDTRHAGHGSLWRAAFVLLLSELLEDKRVAFMLLSAYEVVGLKVDGIDMDEVRKLNEDVQAAHAAESAA